MKSLLFTLIFFLTQLSFAKKVKMSCHFPNTLNQESISDCASRVTGTLLVEKSKLKMIQFDDFNLAGGSIEGEGCYWLNKKGFLRKTYCYDNGADYFQEGLARYINAKGKFGFMDRNLKVKIAAQFTFVFPFENGFAKACQNCKKEKIQNSEHSTMVGGEWVIINKNGKTVKQCLGAQSIVDCN